MRIIRHIFYEEGEMIMLSIKHLTKIYSGNKKAVDDISLDIQSGEFIAFYWNQWKWQNDCFKNDKPYD